MGSGGPEFTETRPKMPPNNIDFDLQVGILDSVMPTTTSDISKELGHVADGPSSELNHGGRRSKRPGERGGRRPSSKVGHLTGRWPWVMSAMYSS